jgi:NAD+ kinase
MKVAIFGKSFLPSFNEYIIQLIQKLTDSNIEFVFYGKFRDYILKNTEIEKLESAVFTDHNELDSTIDFLISVGGDGTFLESVFFVRDKNIPIVGINSGRLGFLSDIAKEEIDYAINALLKNEFVIEERSLLKVKSENNLFEDFNYGLNELTIHKRDTSSMMVIHTFINGELLNTYWADGLIVSTPTGSTAYSMSVGGPIVLPYANNFIIAPIASHNLTVRPIVLPDNQEITLKVEGRDGNFMLSLDSRYEVIEPNIEIKLVKGEFNIKVIKLHSQDFFTTLRNKLLWGIDRRN